MSIFICGETASGKTTTLNAMCTFIKPIAKIYSVENTPEVTMPHPVWQHPPRYLTLPRFNALLANPSIEADVLSASVVLSGVRR